MADALNLGLQQNGSVLRGKSDLEAQYGVVVQTRAVAIPKLQLTGNYQATTETEQFPFPNPPPGRTRPGMENIQIVQNIYQGGQITSALRSAKLTKEQALLQYETTVADSLLQVRVAYYDVLSAEEQVVVEKASVKLLSHELDDQTRRFQAGTVPRFNVLRAEVELANERPRLIQAENAHRIAKNNLVNQLGFHIPSAVLEDVPVQLTDKLDADRTRLNWEWRLPRRLRTARNWRRCAKRNCCGRKASLSPRVDTNRRCKSLVAMAGATHRSTMTWAASCKA